MQLIPAAFRKW